MKSIHVVEDLLPLAWERAVIACWEQGESFPTEYDRPGDPNSRDVTALIHVKRPFDEPRIHRNFPGGLEDLEKYRSEVLYGVHDHWIDPAAGKWEYTYHERLFEYRVGERVFDQIDAVVRKLKAVPHTRRAQAVTWQVWNDLEIDDPACLQRMWFRISGGKLHLNVHFRSNDAFKAAFMNIYAFTELQREVAAKVGVEPGEYIHLADSFHIYGSYFDEFEGFLASVRSRSFEERVYTEAFAREIFVEGCDMLLAEPDMPESKKQLVRRRREVLLGPGA
ncbi:MAG: Thymidylate synthase 1 [Spirochaetes bacterium ADurb.BinA120]|nr:MAG: Thymidylate synthase 1 [Spirochaetes bacterium ADurb.BinA120]HOD83694.1 thymidylate synthase [Phycisphaerae bacterium]HQL72686.1 thymidylate synthase [Phycisphaerae bacterium]